MCALPEYEQGKCVDHGRFSGIGLHLAHEFARHGHPLVLVAPVLPELQKIAAEFERDHGIQVRVIAGDLREENAAQQIFDQARSGGAAVEILVNNAGHGSADGSGKFRSRPISR